MEDLVIAYDLGTTGLKAVVVTIDGQIVYKTTAPITMSLNNHGMVEQSPSGWWDATKAVTQGILSKSKIMGRIIGMGITGQSACIVALDRNGNEVMPAMIHLDARAAEEADILNSVLTERKVVSTTGVTLNAGRVASRVYWIKRHTDNLTRTHTLFLGAKDYLGYRFSGEKFTDFTDAQVSGLFDITRKTWSEEMTSAVGIGEDVLPKAAPSSTIIGELTDEASKETGLKPGIPVVLGASDFGCAAVGGGLISPGEAGIYIGSTGWMSGISSVWRSPEGGKYCYIHPDPALFMHVAFMKSAGHAFNWAMDLLYANERSRGEGNSNIFDLASSEASAVPPGSEGLIFFPYLAGGSRAPFKGAFLGLTLGHGRGAIMRAVMEGLAYDLRNTRDSFGEFSPDTVFTLSGGGAQNHLWRQIVSDVLGTDLQVPVNPAEATALGCAFICMVGLKLIHYSDARKLAKLEMNSKSKSPKVQERYDSCYRLFRSVNQNVGLRTAFPSVDLDV